MHLIWVRRKQKYFLFRGLTPFLIIRSDLPVGLICRSSMPGFDLHGGKSVDLPPQARSLPTCRSSSGPASPPTRRTKSPIVNLECPGSTHEGGTPNAPRTPDDCRWRGDDNLYVSFSNIEQGRETGLQRQGAGAKHSRRHDILPAKLADDRVHGARWSGQWNWRRPDDQAGRALTTGFHSVDLALRRVFRA